MQIKERLAELSAVMAAAAKRAGRATADARLLAVSKTQPPELIEEAYRAGVRDFGENYVQELVEKRAKLAHLTDIRWHLIGHLQTNKAKLVVANAHCFHALDSAKLARELGKRAAEAKLAAPFPVFIQVNVDLEDTKSGVAPEALGEVIAAVRAEPALKLEGLMCIPEPRDSAQEMRPAFKRMVELTRANALVDAKLSMGMSEDFEVAIEEGAHWVRVGRKLFGERKKPL